MNRQRLTWTKESAGGLYGYPKQTESDIRAAVNRIHKRAKKIAQDLWESDPMAAEFLSVHSERTGSLTARILLSHLADLPQPVVERSDIAVEASSLGLYGYRQATGKASREACMALRDAVGIETLDLHRRRAKNYAKITGFLGEHAKQGSCMASQVMLQCYPPESTRIASDTDNEWICWD